MTTISQNIYRHLLVLSGVLFCFLFSGAQTQGWSDDALMNNGLLNGQTTEQRIKQNMFVRVIANSHKIFVGEPLLVEYKFYSAVNSQSTVVKQPEFSGCSVEELDYNTEPYSEVLDGKQYNVYTIRKVQLTPLHEGVLQLGQASVNNNVEVFDEDHPFQTRKFNFTSSNISQAVQVIPLPLKNMPPDFSGITGKFSLTAKVAEQSLPINENGHLIVTIKGSGNMQLINVPEIAWPENIEHFEPTDTQHINHGKFPVSGDKVFDILYLGTKEGRAVLPPVNFNYFDASTQTYATLTSDSIPLIFTAALPNEKVLQAGGNLNNKSFLWIVATIGLIAGVILFAGNKKNKTQKNGSSASLPILPVTEPEPVLNKPLTDFSQELQSLQNSDGNRDFFIKGKHIINIAIREKWGSTVMVDELIVLKQPKNEQLRKDIQSFCATCDFAIYAYADSNHNFELLNNKLASIITRIQGLEM